MTITKYITTSEAVKMHESAGFGKVWPETIRSWIGTYGLGAIKVAGRWRIDRAKFQKLLEGHYERHDTAEETPVSTG